METKSILLEPAEKLDALSWTSSIWTIGLTAAKQPIMLSTTAINA